MLSKWLICIALFLTSQVFAQTATLSPRSQLAESLKPLIIQQTGGDDVNVLIDPHIQLQTTGNIENVSIDPDRKQFIAYVYINNTAQKVTGQYNLLVPVPVLIDNVNRGDVIEESNIDYITVPEKSMQNRVIYSTEDLEGKAAKRNLRAGRPIRTMDVRPPRLVEKGKRVVLTVNNPLMRLTAEGKALEHGGEGDVVKVLNTDSKQVVIGTVIAPGTVEVQ